MPVFEPTRLSLAMRRRGLSQRDVADRIGVTSQYISMFERGQTVPSPDMIERMSLALSFPKPFFYADRVDLLSDDALSFRAQRSMSSSTRNTGLGTSDIAASLISVDLNKRFELPKLDVPDLGSYTPEEAADFLRAYWKLGYEPIQNMVHLLESRGVNVFWINHDSSSLDAFSFWQESRSFVVLNMLKDSGDRARFDAAHELGHLVLHIHRHSLETKMIEDEADRFASAFLLPEEQFRKECPSRPDLNELYGLKPRWKVSVAAMVMRGADLGLFSDWQKRQAFKIINAMGMRQREKVHIPREQSKLHKMVFDALSKKDISPSLYAQTLYLDPSEIEELMPIAKEYRPITHTTGEIRRGHLRVIPGGKSKSVSTDPSA